MTKESDQTLARGAQPAQPEQSDPRVVHNEVDPTLVDDAEPIAVLRAVAYCARHWEGGVRVLGNVRACDIVRACEAFEALVKAADATLEQADEEGWRCYRGTDASRFQQLEYALDNVSPEKTAADEGTDGADACQFNAAERYAERHIADLPPEKEITR